MPYVITTTIPGCGTPCGGEPECERVVVTRRAVATLREAREVSNVAVEVIYSTCYPTRNSAIHGDRAKTVPEAGGTVGPLPDGTVIEVEQVDDVALAVALGWSAIAVAESPEQTAALIDAFNAAQEGA